MAVKQRYRDETERFHAGYLVDARTGCWNWQKSRNHKGYGLMSVKGVTSIAHRYSYAKYHGPIGRSLVLHRCDNPPCVNPEHLYLGSHADNMRDCRERRTRIGVVPDDKVRATIRKYKAGQATMQGLADELTASGYPAGLTTIHHWINGNRRIEVTRELSDG